MIKLNHFSVAYGRREVLDDLNSSWDTNQMIMLVGENGAGKSTLLKSIMGFVDYEGELLFHEQEIKKMKIPQRAKHFAYVAQQKPLPQHERIEDFLLMGVAYRLSLFEQPDESDLAKVDEVLKLFHLEHLRGCFMDELSGGEVQMLYVARCFVEEHEMLILDEPCTYLDYHKQFAFLQLVQNAIRQKRWVPSSVFTTRIWR